jgi:hypothetical protein
MDINLLNYKIDSFDEKNKILRVTFEDDTWAQIRLSTPLPKTIEELENQIKMYAATVEHLQAQTEILDLSFITSNIGVERTCERRSLAPTPINPGNTTDDVDLDELQRTQIIIAIQRTLAEMAGATV